jgi:transposase
LLFYGYAAGVFSSRKINKAIYDSVAFRFISVNTHPYHDTISSFRKRFLEDRLEVIAQAKVTIEERAVQRNAQEQKEYEEKVAKRQAKTEATGKKPRGPGPKPPTPGTCKKIKLI